MSRLTTFKLSALALISLLNAGSASAASSPIGTWIDHTGKGAVEITACDGGLCGRIVWLKSAEDNVACNTQVIGGGKAVGATWDGGWIYDPDAKERYDVEITVVSDTKLKLLGYAGIKMFGETMIWTRATGNLERCQPPGATTQARSEPTAMPAGPGATTPAAAPTAPPSTADQKGTPSPQLPSPQMANSDEDGEIDEAVGAKHKGTCRIEIKDLGKFNFPC